MECQNPVAIMIYIENIQLTEISYPQSLKKVYKKNYYNDYFRTNLKNIKNT